MTIAISGNLGSDLDGNLYALHRAFSKQCLKKQILEIQTGLPAAAIEGLLLKGGNLRLTRATGKGIFIRL